MSSSNGGNQGSQPPKKKPKFIANPYAVAKKKKSTPGAITTTTPAAASSSPSSATAGATSFSQAFGGLEDSKHYHQADAAQAKLRADQRAFEASLDNNDKNDTNGSAGPATAAAVPPPNWSDRDHHTLLEPHVLNVSITQQGNGVLQHIRNVPYKFGRMVPDYIFGPTRCALFLSLRYHALHPPYLPRRIAELQSDFTLRVLLVLVDVEDNANVLAYLNKQAVVHDLTLLLVWSEEEAARYLETLKAFESKDATAIQKKESTNFADQAADFLTAGQRGVNRTDAGHLLAQFGNLRSLAAASADELSLVPGMGQVKIQKLHQALHQPFSKKAAAERRRQRAETAAALESDPDGGDDDNQNDNENASEKVEASDEEEKQLEIAS